jgi:hypothetical protein
MPVPLAPHVTLGSDEQSHLESLVRAHSTPQALVLRGRLLLRSAAPDHPSQTWPTPPLHHCGNKPIVSAPRKSFNINV